MKNFKKAMFFSVLTILICLAALMSATYAWFTSNQTVFTSRVEARTDSADIRLLVSGQGGSAFSGSGETAIVQVNSTRADNLMPVSTADLETFLYNANLANDYAKNFSPVENEQHYYHGRIFIKAEADGQNTSSLALYFDQTMSSGGLLAQSGESELLLNASRLGIKFTDAGTNHIFYLSESENPQNERKINTMVGGNVLEEGQVITLSGGNVTAVTDPAVAVSKYSISESGGGISLPGEPLIKMELNRVYQMDIYFYLEGCDPDCTDAVSLDGCDLHLAFFGTSQ